MNWWRPLFGSRAGRQLFTVFAMLENDVDVHLVAQITAFHASP